MEQTHKQQQINNKGKPENFHVEVSNKWFGIHSPGKEKGGM